ncbi:glycerol-3-phosphate-binding protein [Klebsiella pneumoniae subsp. pneumoniae]|uniref:Glycerol-3-phosphate-binding protein n=1 Tax=Klebsiella pneumoniae subsp. pneumoniae TaxID=72407 RepID=A0A378AQA4_KLEPN|nr:glycerol-3-phosphate-binding protein [Klebsiella pneumoniae subsp. pneumoniae]
MLPSTNDDYGGWIFSALVRANGGKYFNEDYPGEVYYNSPTAIGALRFWQDLIYKDKVMPSGVLNSKQISAAFSPASSDGDAQHRRAGLYAREQQRF